MNQRRSTFKTISKWIRNTLTGFLIAFSCYSVQSQPLSDNSRLRTYLNPVANRLKTQDKRVHIVHIGDSHVQAGFLTAPIRNKLQKQFGDAGRGYLPPLKICRTNQPDDYTMNTFGRGWQSHRSTYSKPYSPVGPSSILLFTRSDQRFGLDIALRRSTFSQIVIIRKANATPLRPSKVHLYDRITNPTGVDDWVIDSYTMQQQFSQMRLIATPSDQRNNQYGAIAVYKRRHGVVWHEMALNGAVNAIFNRTEVVNSISLFHPDIVVISLGTNEALAGMSGQQYRQQATALVRRIKTTMPNTRIVLTTPPVMNPKRYKRHTLQSIVQAVHDIAAEEQVGIIDLYQMMGGIKNASQLKRQNMLRSDGIHFTVKGYKKQGNLIADELLNALK